MEIATASALTPARREIDTAGDENSNTGSSVVSEIAHSASMWALNKMATKTANRNGAAKRTTTKRRRGSEGPQCIGKRCQARPRGDQAKDNGNGNIGKATGDEADRGFRQPSDKTPGALQRHKSAARIDQQ